jgi:hypothetical protein
MVSEPSRFAWLREGKADMLRLLHSAYRRNRWVSCSVYYSRPQILTNRQKSRIFMKIVLYWAELRELMKRFLICTCVIVGMSAGVAFAQEFRTTPRVVPQPQPSRPAVEQNSNSSWFKKFVAAPNKLQLLNPFAPHQYGSGQEVVVANPQDPKERPYAIRLLSFEF